MRPVVGRTIVAGHRIRSLSLFLMFKDVDLKGGYRGLRTRNSIYHKLYFNYTIRRSIAPVNTRTLTDQSCSLQLTIRAYDWGAACSPEERGPPTHECGVVVVVVVVTVDR